MIRTRIKSYPRGGRAARVGGGFEPTGKEIQAMVRRLGAVMPWNQAASMTACPIETLRQIVSGRRGAGLHAKAIWLVYCLTFDRAKLDSALSIASWGELQEEPPTPRPTKTPLPVDNCVPPEEMIDTKHHKIA